MTKYWALSFNDVSSIILNLDIIITAIMTKIIITTTTAIIIIIIITINDQPHRRRRRHYRATVGFVVQISVHGVSFSNNFVE